MNTSKRRAILRRLRQEPRAKVVELFFDKKLISERVRRCYIIFGGDVAVYQADEQRDKRDKRTLRAIRRHQRLKQDREQLAKLRGQKA